MPSLFKAITLTLLLLQPATQPIPFTGQTAGDARTIAGIDFRWCPPGAFTMGSPESEPGHRPDEHQIQVTLTGFWMAKTETTQAQYQSIMGSLPTPATQPAGKPAHPHLGAGKGDDYPVYWVSYDQAEAYCKALTAKAHASGQLPKNWEFKIPTEAQWEYACRAGTTTAYHTGPTLTPEQATFNKPYNGIATGVPGSAATPVASYPPNAWGLHDMHGNEFEWTRDYFHRTRPGGTDPDLSQIKGMQNRDGSYSRVRKGGAWVEKPHFCRSAVRLPYEPHRTSDHIGFRISAVPIFAPTSTLPDPTTDGYRLVFSDEFDTPGRPNPDNWNFEAGFRRNQELQYYKPDNAWVEGGHLIIEGRREKMVNEKFNQTATHWTLKREYAEYTSASLNTARKHSWLYGRILVRAKIPAKPGLWPAIWTLGSAREWPGNGEIDIMEYYAEKLHANAAWASPRRWRGMWDSFNMPLSDLGENWADDFHIWRMDWDATSIRLYVDDRLLNTIELSKTINLSFDHANPFKEPHYLLLNLAIGGNNGGDPEKTEFPARYLIDYVRVYQKP